LTGLVASTDGKQLLRTRLSGPADQAEELGLAVAEALLEMGADDILKQIYEADMS